MDKSHNTHKEFAQHTCAEHTRKLLGGKSGMMFYDVTSFALRHGDTLSKVGLSKEGFNQRFNLGIDLIVRHSQLSAIFLLR